MQKLLFTIILMTCFVLSHAQNKDGRYVKANQDRAWTLNNLIHYNTSKLEVDDPTWGHGTATAYYDTTLTIHLIQAVWLQSSGRHVRNMFYRAGQPYLIEDQEVSYDSPVYYTSRRVARYGRSRDTTGTPTETITHQIYLDSDTVYRWLGPKGVIVNTSIPAVQDTASALLKWSNTLYERYD